MLKKIFIELYYLQLNIPETINKIDEYLFKMPVITTEFLILYQPSTHHETTLLSLIKQTDPSFCITNEESNQLSASFFLELLNTYQNNCCSAHQICEVYNRIEMTLAFPSWLIPDLYHVCDWFDCSNFSIDLNIIEKQKIKIQQWLKEQCLT